MKVLSTLLLVATLALATFAHVVRSNGNDDSIKDNSTPNATSLSMDEIYLQFFEAYKHVMPCGIPAYNLPPLAPFRSPHIKVNHSGEHYMITGEIENLSVFGLDDFFILQLSTNTSTNRTKTDLLYKNIQILGKVNLTVEGNLAGFKFVQPLEGFLNIQFINMRVATAMNVGQNDVGGIKVSNFEYTLHVADIAVYNLNTNWSVAVNNFVNQYVQDFAKLFLQIYREPSSKMYADIAMGSINKALYNVTLSSLSSSLNESIKLFKSIECRK